MRVRTILATAVLTALASVVYAVPAEAQATRTWVSAVGDDANPCSRTAPCRTFQGALSKTAAGGEIDCLDSSGFGALSISSSITIYCEGVVGGVAGGIVVNASGGVVILRGLNINGGTTGTAGIQFVNGAELHVQDCLIHNFTAGTASGILFTPSGPAKLFVSDTDISNNGAGINPNGSAGIQVEPSGSGSTYVELERVRANANTVGLRVQGANTSGTIDATVRDSTFGGNGANGIEIEGGGEVYLMLEHVASVNNAQIGIAAEGGNATIIMANSQVTGNGQGLDPTNGGLMFSYGNNQIDGNSTDGPAPTIMPQK